MIKIFYILQHLFSIFALDKRFKILYILFSLYVYIVIYLLKQDTFDLIIYKEYIGNPIKFETGYTWLSMNLNLLLEDSHLVLRAIQFILLFCFLYSIKFVKSEKKDTLMMIVIILSSAAFILGVNNVIRQAFASLFIIWALLNIVNKQYILSFMLLILAILFHKSSILLYVFLIYSYLVYEMIYKKYNFSIGASLLVHILLSLVGLLGLYILFKNGFYTSYANMNMIGDGIRTLFSIKIVAISMVFLASEKFLYDYNRDSSLFEIFRFIRMFLLVFLILLSFNPGIDELGARIMYYYFMVEMFLMLYSWNNERKLSVVIILSSYLFAINAINILAGV